MCSGQTYVFMEQPLLLLSILLKPSANAESCCVCLIRHSKHSSVQSDVTTSHFSSLYLFCYGPSLILHLSSFNVLEFQESTSTFEFLFYFCSFLVSQDIHFYGDVKFKPLAFSVILKFKFVCLNGYLLLLLESLMCISNRMPVIGHGSLAKSLPPGSQPLLIDAKLWIFLSHSTAILSSSHGRCI